MSNLLFAVLFLGAFFNVFIVLSAIPERPEE